MFINLMTTEQINELKSNGKIEGKDFYVGNKYNDKYEVKFPNVMF